MFVVPAQITNSFTNSPQITTMQLDLFIFFVVRVLFLIGFFLYILFAFLAVRQIEDMRKTVITPLSGIIQFAGYLHLMIAIMIFLFAWSFLK